MRLKSWTLRSIIAAVPVTVPAHVLVPVPALARAHILQNIVALEGEREVPKATTSKP